MLTNHTIKLTFTVERFISIPPLYTTHTISHPYTPAEKVNVSH